MRKLPRSGRGSEQGNVLVFVTFALIALFGFAAWSTETGQAWTAKGQLQGASDSAALAGAGALLVPNAGQPADPDAAVASAQSYGAENQSIGVPITIPADDVETGSWSLQQRLFTPLPGSTDPNQVRAVKVLGRRDDVANGPVATVLGRIFGVDEIAVAADAIAYVGFAGLMPANTALLPIALDCCQIAGAACEQSYCPYAVDNPPNPCPLSEDHATPGATATCLEFHSTPEQNACWTVMDPDHPAVSSNDLRDIVENGNSSPVGEQPIYLDNGTKTPVVDEISDRFHGQGSYDEMAGVDLDGDGDADSWVLPLPVVECQNPGAQCASGTPQRIVGVACFDVQEVLVTPDKIIKGSFVCPGDPRWSDSACGVGFGPGGVIPTIDARYPVLVE